MIGHHVVAKFEIRVRQAFAVAWPLPFGACNIGACSLPVQLIYMYMHLITVCESACKYLHEA